MNSRKARGHSGRSSVLQRIIIGFASGMAAYLITNLTSQPQIWVITVSTFVGGTILVVQFLVGLEQTVNEGFERVNQATQILASIEASALPSEKILRIVDSASKFGPTTASTALVFMGYQLDSTANLLDGMSRGEVEYQGEDRNWLLWLTESSELSIEAMSPALRGEGDNARLEIEGGSIEAGPFAQNTDFLEGFWVSDMGQRYLDAQNRACDRKVRIRRIFHLQHPDLIADPLFKKRCQEQEELGIEVRIDTKPHTLHDWVIFDGRIIYEVAPESRSFGKASLMTSRVSIIPTRVAERSRTFESLWDKAVPLENLE